jgi:hypothetical protein
MKKTFFWLPRLLAIAFILFISMFALDIFGQGYNFWQTVVGLFMHLIPSFILILTVAISWRRPKIGGIIFLLLALVYVLTMRRGLLIELPIAGPAIIIALLFFIQPKQTAGKIFKNQI